MHLLVFKAKKARIRVIIFCQVIREWSFARLDVDFWQSQGYYEYCRAQSCYPLRNSYEFIMNLAVWEAVVAG